MKIRWHALKEVFLLLVGSGWGCVALGPPNIDMCARSVGHWLFGCNKTGIWYRFLGGNTGNVSVVNNSLGGCSGWSLIILFFGFVLERGGRATAAKRQEGPSLGNDLLLVLFFGKLCLVLSCLGEKTSVPHHEIVAARSPRALLQSHRMAPRRTRRAAAFAQSWHISLHFSNQNEKMKSGGL